MEFPVKLCASESQAEIMEPNLRDEAILRFLAEKDIALPPTPIYENLRLEGATFSQRTVSRRLKLLHEEGYVEKILGEKGYYQITEKGRQYLNNEPKSGNTSNN